MKVFRVDRGTLNKPVELPNGWLRCDGFIGRSGILEYARADGSVWREYRPPEEAFHADALESFHLVPLTNEHPREGMLTAENTHRYQRGTVERPTRDGEAMRATILITDAATIADARAGKAELSCGYMAEVEETPGEIDGQRYDAIQRNVRGNHVAAVSAGRAGSAFRLRVDSLAADVVLSDSPQIGRTDSPEKDTSHMIKIKIHGVEYEVSQQVAQALQSERGDARQAVDTAEARATQAQATVEKLTARADAADAQVTKLKAELAEAPTKIRATEKARAQLEAQAEKFLPGEKFDGKSDLEIKSAVAEKAMGFKLDGKAAAYVEAMFDIAIKGEHTLEPEPVTAPINGTRTDANDPAAKADREFRETLDAHFKK